MKKTFSLSFPSFVLKHGRITLKHKQNVRTDIKKKLMKVNGWFEQENNREFKELYQEVLDL